MMTQNAPFHMHAWRRQSTYGDDECQVCHMTKDHYDFDPMWRLPLYIALWLGVALVALLVIGTLLLVIAMILGAVTVTSTP